MSDWGWITFGYAVVYSALSGYGIFLTARYRRAVRKLEGVD